MNHPFVYIDDFPCQTQANAVAAFFGTEKGNKDFITKVVGDSATVVGNSEIGIPVLCDSGNLHKSSVFCGNGK
jgi:hypothetical protein